MEIKDIASGSTGNSYLLSDGNTRLIIEAGVPIASIQRGCDYSLSSYTACLISHSHGDHAGHAKEILARGIDVYTSAGTIDACKLVGHRLHVTRAREQFVIGSWSCMAFDIQHDAPEPFGFLLQSIATREKLLYFSDTPTLKYQFSGITHMMAECNYDRETLLRAVEEGTTPVEAVPRICNSHMGLETLLPILAANDLSQLKKIYLLHLSNRHADEKRIKLAVQRATGVEVTVFKSKGAAGL